jgi:hypothetical protein
MPEQFNERIRRLRAGFNRVIPSNVEDVTSQLTLAEWSANGDVQDKTQALSALAEARRAAADIRLTALQMESSISVIESDLKAAARQLQKK